MPCSAAARDEEFRLRLAAGDDSALREVYDLFAPVVHGLAARVTANAEAAKDVTQEVFTELWSRPLAFDPKRARCGPGSRCLLTGARWTGCAGRCTGAG